MKHIILLILFLTCALCLSAQGEEMPDSMETPTTTEVVQDTPKETATTPQIDDLPENPFIDPVLLEKLEIWNGVLYSGLTIIFGYLSFLFPGLRKIQDTELRIGAGALVLAGIFLNLGFGNGATLAIAFIISTKLYDLVFSRFQKTPKPVETGPTNTNIA